LSDARFPFRYELLDGFRGLAALAVVASHLQIVDVGREAVMLFFVISGYCIAASAESCRLKSLSFPSFMARRVHRIYPPYLLAILFYVLTRCIKVAMGGPNDLHRPWLDWVQNLTMTQWLTLLVHPVADVVQNPTLVVTAIWSLNYEEQFYLVMAVALTLALRVRVSIVIIVLVLAGAGLLWNILWPGGWMTGLFLEYWIDFAAGAVLFYVQCVYTQPSARIAFIGAVMAMTLWAASRIFPWDAQTALHDRAWVEISVCGTFALFLYVLRPYSAAISRTAVWRPVAALGVISYSLYLIHQFNLTLVEATVGSMLAHAWQPVRASAMLLAEIGIAAIFWYGCERPFLNRSKGGPASGRALSRVWIGNGMTKSPSDG